MYQRDIPYLPIETSRGEFVNLVFELGSDYSHSYENIVASVQLGDFFVNFHGPRTPFIYLDKEGKKKYKDEKNRRKNLTPSTDNSEDNNIMKFVTDQIPGTFMYELTPQIYSLELAHVVTAIISKFNEESGATQTESAIVNSNNRFVVKMEWEICFLLNYHVKIYNFMTVITDLILKVLESPHRKNSLSFADSNEDTSNNVIFKLGSVFKDLCKEICMDRNLLLKDPRTIVLGTIILYEEGRLRAIKTNRRRLFTETISIVAREYELNTIDMLREYISSKKNSKYPDTINTYTLSL